MSPAQSIPRRGYIIVDKDNPPGPSGAIRIFSNDQMWSAPEKVSQIKCIFESLFWLLSQGVAVRLLVFCFQRRCHWAGIYWAFSLLTVLRFRLASKMLKKNLLQKAILSSQQNSLAHWQRLGKSARQNGWHNQLIQTFGSHSNSFYSPCPWKGSIS